MGSVEVFAFERHAPSRFQGADHAGHDARWYVVDHASPAWSVSVFDEKINVEDKPLDVFFESSWVLFTRLEALGAKVARDAAVLSRRGPKRDAEIDVERGRSGKARMVGGMPTNIVWNEAAEKGRDRRGSFRGLPKRSGKLAAFGLPPTDRLLRRFRISCAT